MRIFNRKTYEQANDITLLEEYHTNPDLKILGELFKRYMALVYGVGIKYLKNRDKAQDAVMDIFEKLPSLISNHEIKNFKSWLYVVTKNHCLMIIRKADFKSVDLSDEENQNNFMESLTELHPDNENDLERDLDILQLCIEKLKEWQQKCVKRFFLDSKCYKEISEEFELDINKVKSHIQNGKRNLKICIEEHGE